MFLDMLEDLKGQNILFFWNILLSMKVKCELYSGDFRTKGKRGRDVRLIL